MKKTVFLIVTFTPFSKLFIESGCSGANNITQTQLQMHEHTEIDSNTLTSPSFKKKIKQCKFMLHWAHDFKQIMADWEH